MEKGQTYHITTFGCQMNKSESERIATVLERMGYIHETEVYQADIVILNACSVRQAAIDRIWGYARNLLLKRKQGKETKIILTGCLLPQDKRNLSKKFDFVFNIKDIKQLVEYLSPEAYIEDSYFDILPKYKSKAQAFVPIMTGCDNFCTYCCVPFTKGREIYRSVDSIMQEIKTLAKYGCKEITLLGQNVNTYQPHDLENFSAENPYTDLFAKLLWEVNAVEGIERIMYTAAHPKDMSDEVIDAFKLPAVLNYLHLALQSGNDAILKRMNRKYTAEDYYTIIEKLRAVSPTMALGTDIIVGFPGETDEQFQDTYDFYKKVSFDISYTAKYSVRVGTPAAKFKDQIDLAVKKDRWKKMQVLMEDITLEKNQQYKDQIVSVLVDSFNDGNCEGNSREMKRTRFKGDKSLVGQIVPVKVTNPMTWLLKGELVV